ncbi:hypothetical protein TNIN_324811 [Trichonephila inaurata madagascariensis]|uniref:Uncharacterized protein n=1 Tax=Trichonephila inaurata madagascariensis TaxID=2747483 RepID=A0A8X6XRG0_9ARAC|nr:hypothetical protein TNIN_324811 [Trichonephila inaurata madagascariensis]
MCGSKKNSLKHGATFREKLITLDYFKMFPKKEYLNESGRKRRSSADDGVMDDCMAAMVLMSLSCSPKSPCLPITDGFETYTCQTFSHGWHGVKFWGEGQTPRIVWAL